MKHIRRFLKLLLVAFFGAATYHAATLLPVFNFPDFLSTVPLADVNLSYVDFLTVALTCVTVVLAATGIGIGVVAAYTITNIKNDAKSAVDSAVDKQMKILESDLAKRVSTLAYDVGKNLDDDADPDLEER